MSVQLTIQQEIELVKDLGDEIGYGHLMNLASALWRKALKEKGYPENGAFVTTIFFDEESKKNSEKTGRLYDELISIDFDINHDAEGLRY